MEGGVRRGGPEGVRAKRSKECERNRGKVVGKRERGEDGSREKEMIEEEKRNREVEV